MRDEYVFPIDKVTRKGMVCIIQGVKYRDDPSQKTRLTILGGGLEYRRSRARCPRARRLLGRSPAD